MYDKHGIRAEIRAKVKALQPMKKKEYSIETCRQVLSSPQWKSANRIMAFLSLADEIDTSLLLADTSKKLYVPKVNGDEIDVYEYSAATVAPGAFGILEPSENAALLRDPSLLDLVIVPGLAFTESGVRLGRGKGFYDRFLHNVSCQVWGIAFPQQIVDSIPADPWDIPIDGVFHC
ncbi:MAG: 5-formyltetrahydrofolate cyclo-ligase [Bacteroidales bacterium]|nr:5-formyltetrahydrofolate cyclo-ligase [Bacteroidales bacterium]MDY6002528.1 5-formyltetrahydrofolate cyclo-ligase [Candidatus Cryptobacteroides sp.]